MNETAALIETWARNDAAFLFENDRIIRYSELSARVDESRRKASEAFQGPIAVAMEGENGFRSYLKLISFLAAGYAVHCCPSYLFRDPAYRAFLGSETGTDFHWSPIDEAAGDRAAPGSARIHPEIRQGFSENRSQLIVRTSGSSGRKYKYVLHDVGSFLRKYERIGKHFCRTLAFSPLESIAGFETLFEVLAHGCSLVAAGDRLSPQVVATLIREHEIDYFQTTPSFLNLMRMTKQVSEPGLGPLRKIAYGSEPPPHPSTFAALREALPAVEFKHTYGMSEIGILHTVTDQSDPSRFRLDENLNPGRIRDGLLEVRSSTRLISYLNHPVDETGDGWFRTSDLATESNGWIAVIGRSDDTINVAGRKFLPFELELLISELENVGDVTVVKEANSLIGHAIVAEIVLERPESEESFRLRFRRFCEDKVPFFMHPHRVVLLDASMPGPRLKKMRKR